MFDTAALAPHGVCLLWRPELIWLHAISDALTGLAYWSIPVVLIIIARRRKDLIFPWAFDLFALFILACGLTHFAAIWTLWNPDYGIEGAIKGATALVSVATAVALWPLLPRILALPTHDDLAAANAALTREVAERRDAEARARSSEARFTRFFQHVADGLFVVRATTEGFEFETVNPRFAALLGLPVQRIEGARPDSVLDPAAAAELMLALSTCLTSGTVQDWESGTAGEAPDGRHWHTVLVPLPPENDGAHRLLGSVRDISALRRLQADLTETARRAVIGTMAAGVAHEMSQPVNIIGLWAERGRAAMQDLPAIVRRALEVALDQTRRLGTLLDRMRDLTCEGGNGEAGPFDAAATAGSAVEVARRTWSLEGIAVEMEPPATGPLTVFGRSGLLEQAMLHILENARDAVEERRRRDPGAPARIAVALTLSPDGGALAISVRDTGGGVPTELGDRIFDPFVTTKDAGHGCGLGLPLAAGLVRALGGSLRWRNHGPGTAEAGAEFRIHLPLLGAQAPDRAA